MSATEASSKGFAVRRQDRWWLYPANVVVWLTLFGAYSLWTIVFFRSGQYHSYLSPFYSPLVAGGRVPFSPALLIFYIPLGFRLTCYYYRKAYYRSFFADPPACAVREPLLGAALTPTGRQQRYRGESKLPFILSNLHRFFLYFAIAFVIVLWIDAFASLRYQGQWGFGLGTVILFVNIAFLTLYTFSCHSWRHLVGGSLNCYSCARAGRQRHGAWSLVSRLNLHHSTYAWISLFTLVGADLYIRLLQFGVLHDPHIGF